MKILHPEKAKEIDEGTEDLPEFEKLGNIYNDFQPFKILWNEDTNVMAALLWMCRDMSNRWK